MREGGAEWAALVLELPEGLDDELAGSLGANSLGTHTTGLGPGRVALRIYTATLAEADVLLAAAREALAALGVGARQFDARIEAVADRRWVEAYQAGLRPFPIGERFLVVPDGRPHAQPGRTSLLLVPGRAFGTGEHPTTRMCVAALERCVVPGSRWLDLGCGSGILALVALHCGAARVHARDDDPEAIEVAREVIEANDATRGVQLAVGSADDLAGAELDGVVANIAAPYFLAHAARAAAPLRPGGVLIATGFLAGEIEEITPSLRAAHLSVVARDRLGEWELLVAQRDVRA